MTPQERFRAIMQGVTFDVIDRDIIPSDSPIIRIKDKYIVNDLRKDWVLVTCPQLIMDSIVFQFIERETGLDRWYIVPGFPYLNSENLYEWRLRR